MDESQRPGLCRATSVGQVRMETLKQTQQGEHAKHQKTMKTSLLSPKRGTLRGFLNLIDAWPGDFESFVA